ncbi:AAA domain-containing protein [Candidatus Haliotispira prima]|uniref:AAA domain-containing protein n=1 Tax=Candidatus Haliotispira prima TaxID=3034016 RepID=A0ABY8MFQ0_9SPIO|nr:AAA domain-containing protein [Candidatus Haliotispira prima]
MALLYYENLTDHRPDMLMRKTFGGLQDFYKFLNTTKQYLESEKAVKCLGWEPVTRDEEEENGANIGSTARKCPHCKALNGSPEISYQSEEHANKRAKALKFKSFVYKCPKGQGWHLSSGFWVKLVGPKGISQNFDANFKHFLDENNEEVYEANSQNWVNIGAASRECTQCKPRNGKPKIAYQSKEHAVEVAENAKVDLSFYECPHGQGWHLKKDLNGRVHFGNNNKLDILDRDPQKKQLKLNRCPDESLLVLRPNTYQIKCQIEAIQALQDKPSQSHRPLLRLFEASSHAKWEGIDRFDDPVTYWYILTDDQRPGTDEQRKWVEMALHTPDFTFLEGPPGSGKTTAICELVIQLARRGKRALLCASTHVAVDNVLERLMDENNKHRDCILPIRIGDSSNVSPKAKPWQLNEFMDTECKRLLNELRKVKNFNNAQQELFEQLRAGRETIQKMVLDSANLVCGTTIGILQHPDIKNREKQSPQFDLMIIDEASKTTFQEFLVPALLAKRWVLVGDPKQLSPYVDDESTAVNIEPCLPEEYKRNACVDVFKASKQRVSTLICSGAPKTIEFCKQQAASAEVLAGTPDSSQDELCYASVVIGASDFLEYNQENLPLDIGHIRSPERVPESIKRKSKAYCRLSKESGNNFEPGTWQAEIAWRLARWYEQRLNEETKSEDSDKRTTGKKLKEQIQQLLPFDDKDKKDSVWEGIDRVRRVALPSVLESLQKGFERNTRQRDDTALSDGLPDEVLQQRLVTLSWQHRMHPEMAEFPHQSIYNGEALHTPKFLEGQRQWTYRPGSKRCLWHDVNGEKDPSNANQDEVNAVIRELESFDTWAQTNPNTESGRKKSWEVALLTFYRGQEKVLRQAVRDWPETKSEFGHFHRGGTDTPYLDIQVCTVDRFQGHEADFVMLSFSSPFATSFLESPNRLNVAITRARYQLVVFGNRNRMKKASGVLGKFAKAVTWDKSLAQNDNKGVKR